MTLYIFNILSIGCGDIFVTATGTWVSNYFLTMKRSVSYESATKFYVTIHSVALLGILCGIPLRTWFRRLYLSSLFFNWYGNFYLLHILIEIEISWSFSINKSSLMRSLTSSMVSLLAAPNKYFFKGISCLRSSWSKWPLIPQLVASITP